MSRAASARGRTGSAPSGGSFSRNLHDYFWRSSSPLTVLLFLLPLIILYEIGTRYYASDWVRHTETRVLAFNLMRQFLGLFGATGQYLPCMAVVGILLAWHIARKDPWDLHVGTAGMMLLESCLLAIPVLALGNIVGYMLPLYTPTDAWKSGVVLGIGAGIYEELIFRLMAFTLLDILLVDLLQINRRSALIVIAFSSSILFAAYHYWSPQSDLFRWRDFIFRTLAGLYFGVLFLVRGFGVTAGSHTAYDVMYFALRAVALR